MSWLGRLFGKRASSDAIASTAAPDVEDGDDLIAQAEAALKTVIDPEIGINIVDLGLVYALRTGDGMLEAEIGLTSPSCPLGEFIADQAHGALAPVAGGYDHVRVHLVRDRKWSADRMSPAARRQLART